MVAIARNPAATRIVQLCSPGGASVHHCLTHGFLGPQKERYKSASQFNMWLKKFDVEPHYII